MEKNCVILRLTLCSDLQNVKDFNMNIYSENGFKKKGEK